MTQNECFSMTNASATMYTDKSIDNQGSLSWAYQYCTCSCFASDAFATSLSLSQANVLIGTQWGYLQTGSGVPEDQLPLIPRVIDIEYLSSICRYAFNISAPADVEAINQYGGFNISYPRLAIVGGQADPWRAATGLALDIPDRLNESSTVSQPLILIEGAVHHWDENNLWYVPLHTFLECVTAG